MSLSKYKKAIDLSANNKPLIPAAIDLWGISRAVVRIDPKRADHERVVKEAGCELVNYAYPWFWSTPQKSVLTPDVFLDIEPPTSGTKTLRQVATEAAKLTKGQAWNVYLNFEGLTLFLNAGGIPAKIWLARWNFTPSTETMFDNLLSHYWMVQVAPGADDRFPWNWAGRGLIDLSIYKG